MKNFTTNPKRCYTYWEITAIARRLSKVPSAIIVGLDTGSIVYFLWEPIPEKEEPTTADWEKLPRTEFKVSNYTYPRFANFVKRKWGIPVWDCQCTCCCDFLVPAHFRE